MMGRRPAWTPPDWRACPALQQPDYAGSAVEKDVLTELAGYPRIVTVAECTELRRRCAAAARGDAFILQAGDCAESIDRDPVEAADAMVALMERTAALIPRPVVQIGRIAGQFAKPRSSETESRDDTSLPAYRGDAINGRPFEPGARRHDPNRLLEIHRHSSRTVERIRSLDCAMFTSHEALVLPYEEALAFVDADGTWWAGSGHMLWIGDRTRQPDGAHIRFASGIGNVIGVKCGPTISNDEMLALAERIDPGRDAGKLLFIARFGSNFIAEKLPNLLRSARREGLAAGWMIDPMHGNTQLRSGRKQRNIADMVAELDDFLSICGAEGVLPAGIHLEVSADDVNECVGPDGVDPGADFACDPRLNEQEAANLVRRVALVIRSPVEA